MTTTEHGIVGSASTSAPAHHVPAPDLAGPGGPDGAQVAMHSHSLPPAKPGFLGRMSPRRRRQWEEAQTAWVDAKRAEDPHFEFRQSFEVLPGSRYVVHNRTPFLIRVQHASDPEYGELLLPPFSERLVKGARLRPFEDQLRTHRQRHEVFLRRHDERISAVNRFIILVWLATIAVVGVSVYDVLSHGTLRRPEFFALAIAAAVIVALVLGTAALSENRRKREAAAAATEAGDVAFGIGGAFSDGNETARAFHHLVTLALVLCVGLVLPTLMIVFGTDTKDFLVIEGGLRVVPGMESRLIARVIQITYTVILSLFPALLFFQFERQRAGNLRAQWVRALFRMDNRMRTIADVNATYGAGMFEASHNSDDSVRMLGGKHSPIVVATILISLGWTVLVMRTESYDFVAVTEAARQTELAEVASEQADAAAQAAVDAAEAGDTATAEAAAAEAAAAAGVAEEAEAQTAEVAEESTQAVDTPAGTGGPGTTTGAADADDMAGQAAAAAEQAVQAAEASKVNESQIQRTSFFQVLTPNPSASGMAFLGAYFFGIYLVLRSYFRGDLRAKIYNQITARLITVVVVAYLINALAFETTDQQTFIWALAFLAGVVPATVIDYVFKSLGSVLEGISAGRFTPSRPLEHLDGADIYDSSRLESEGIPDVAALANSDLANLMITTRLPIGRLVDWADQAVLMVVVSPGTPRRLDRRVWSLRSRGIRTGTDMLAAIEGGQNLDAIRKCLQLDPERGSDDVGDDTSAQRAGSPATTGASVPSVPESITGADEHGDGATPEGPATAHTATDPTPLIRQEADLDELAAAIRRLPVMRQILQWRCSPLDDTDRVWIELPPPGRLPDPNSVYAGPRPRTGPMTERVVVPFA